MITNNLKKTILLIFGTALLSTNLCFAEQVDIETYNTQVEYGRIQYDAKTFKEKYNSITTKFVNLNVKSAYIDMTRMILDNEGNDYYMMLLSDKSVSLGFFDLANLALSKIIDYEIAELDSENTKRLYFPKYKMSKKEIVQFAETYSNIQYNDRSDEAIKFLLSDKVSLNDNDYANYLLALGYLKQNDTENAKNYIQKAMLINSENLNYKILQSQIIANTKKSKKALKLTKQLKKKTHIDYLTYKEQLDANEQYILYKTEKQPWLKDYYLGYYHYLNGENNKALRVLQMAISKNNSRNAVLYSLMSRIYMKNGEMEKAHTVATKAYNYNLSNINTLLTLGDIAYENSKYKQALKYYKQAANSRKSAPEAKLKLADTYAKLNNIKTSNNLYKQIAKQDSTAYEAFYHIALAEPALELDYLKKSVAINPNFRDGWIDLSRVMIEKGNLAQAKKYLENAYYINGSDFRYYYYQGLLLKKTEELNKTEKE